MKEMLQSDMECEGLLECFHDLKQIDKAVFRLLTDAEEPLTVDEIAAGVDRERSTAYRSIQRLLSAGFLRKDQVNYEQGGYHHVYAPRDAEEITRELQRMLNDWYAEMGQLVSEFGEKYADGPDHSAEAEG
ncbi:helix-turn-helix domain-containing protein [Halolamina sp.]|uniref:helix-turn-helix domain-containing protein n=1 Tax=Halolamina sp. TaxID=1940283 RepID=UPI000223C092|nr:transcriptional regulator, TrmB [halophilic archaeon DL31]